jgi:hypothetical protein
MVITHMTWSFLPRLPMDPLGCVGGTAVHVLIPGLAGYAD